MAFALLVVLMLRVANIAALASAPTLSTPERLSRKARSDVSLPSIRVFTN
jgi:hypothetical protein